MQAVPTAYPERKSKIRKCFEYSVEVLVQSEQKIKAANVLQRVGKKYLFNEHLKQKIALRKKKEQEARRLAILEKQQWNKAVDACKRFRQTNRLHKKYTSLRDDIRVNEKIKNDEVGIIHILTNYYECKSTIKELDEKKPKGFISYFRSESAQSKAERKNMMGNIEKLDKQIINHSLVSENFKTSLKEDDIPNILEKIDKEKEKHEITLKKCEEKILKARAEVISLLPI